MVVIMIISLIMMMAAPAYQQVQKKAKAGALVNDFRVFSSVYMSYAHEKGGWPVSSANPGDLPGGITSQDLKADVWMNRTLVGGNFDWETNYPVGPDHCRVITITGPDMVVDIELFQMVDEALDDGNLATGNFQLGDGNSPVFVLER